MPTMRWPIASRLSTIATIAARETAAAINGRKAMSKSPWALASVALGALLLSSAASADTFAYIGNADSNDISVFHVEPASGEVKQLQTVPFPGVGKPGSSTPMAI